MGTSKGAALDSEPAAKEKKPFEDGFPLPTEEKMPGYYDRPCSFWQRLPYRSDTGGVAPIYIEGREWLVAERTRGMTPERRAWRKKFLADQVLSPREPVYVPGMYIELNNPIRRAIKYPFNKLNEVLVPLTGEWIAKQAVSFSKWSLTFAIAGYCMAYFTMFHGGDWERQGGIRLWRNKPVVFPGDPDYPFVSTRTQGDDYFDHGFKKSNFYKSEEQIRAEEAARVKY